MTQPGKTPSPESGATLAATPMPGATGPHGHGAVDYAQGLMTGPQQPISPLMRATPGNGLGSTVAMEGSIGSSEIQQAPPRPSAPVDPLVGTTLDGRYVIDRVMGEGGMGVVYAARHRLIDRKVALKVLRKEFANDAEILERFVQEAKTATSIGNPHIVDILDFGVMPDGSTYFVMEYLDGKGLTSVILEKPDPRRIATIGMQATDGLFAAHERGIVHRDLKPDNLFVIERAGAEFIKVLDFGIAKVTNSNTGAKLTKAGAVFGTPHYMSPEQAAGTAVDHRADIYAMGVILYEMASGQLPFDSDNYMGILTQHMYKAPVPIRALLNNTDCPPALEAIIQKCLEKRPERRYQTCRDLGADLKLFLDGEVPVAVRELMSNPSAQFHVPADYFRDARMPASGMVPATPSKKGSSSAKLLIGVAVVLVLLAAGLGATVMLRKPTVVTGTDPSVNPPPPPPSAVPSVVVPPVEGVGVEVRADVAGAVVIDGDKEVPLPARITVLKGKTRTLVVKSGTTTQVLELDDQKPLVEVSFAAPTPVPSTTPVRGPATGPRAPTGPATTAAPTSKPDDGLIFDLYGKPRKTK